MNKIKKIFFYVLIITSLLAVTPVIADSGWGTDYGSSSGSFGSSSGGISTRGGASSLDLLIYGIIAVVNVVFIVSIIIIRKKEIKKFSNLKNQDNKSDVVLNREYNGSRDLGLDNSPYVGDFDSEIQKFFPDLNERSLIEKLVNIFIDIQEAWMLFDDDSLVKLCSDELYNSYKSDLDVLKVKNEQNIMNDFGVEACNIKGIREENGVIIIDLYLHLTFRDYVINGNGDVIRGDFNKRKHNQYNLEYIINKDVNDNICPSCGAKIAAGLDKCNYCNTLINKVYTNIVLNKKSEL